tara:strand:- start:246 stop:590 length:345 start_codon:yes stop_codon:yes gene_type:complete
MSNRIFKVQDLLHKEIAYLLIKDIQNPLISKTVTISGVRVSKDLKYSEVFFTSLINTNYKKIEDELNKASSYIKNELSKKLHLKRLPSIKFTYDETAVSSERIEKLIKSVTKNK